MLNSPTGCKSLGILLASVWLSSASIVIAQQASSNQVDSVDLNVLMRGPVHEGFAEPAVPSDPQGESSSVLHLAEAIPDLIDEQPAQARPYDQRRESIWLPGYWGVEEADQLCWVSGNWRYSPPGMQWVPGYWTQDQDGYVWVPGFWIGESEQQISYLPPPPQLPSDMIGYQEFRDGQFWVPGKYVWQHNTYRWIEGFWAPIQPDWVWVPHRVLRTPRGYVQVSGYWDYPIDRRGTLFAPVRFASRARYQQTYRPSVVINVTQALASWFVRPSYGHYYFGNYYGDQYRNFGLQPWAPYARNVNRYDPLFVYYSATRNNDLRALIDTHQRFVAQKNPVLPVTYNEYVQRRRQDGQQMFPVNLARSVDELISGENVGDVEGFANLKPLRETGENARLQRFEEQAESMRRFARGRRDSEASQRADQAGQQARERGQQRAEDMREGGREAAQQAREQAGDAAKQAQQRGEETAEEARERGQQARERGQQRAEDMRERGREAAQQAREQAGDAPDSDAPDEVQKRGRETAEEAQQRAQQARERGQQRAEDMRERGREAAQQARDQAGDAADQTQRRGKETAEEAQQRAQQARERGQQRAEDMRERGREAIGVRPGQAGRNADAPRSDDDRTQTTPRVFDLRPWRTSPDRQRTDQQPPRSQGEQQQPRAVDRFAPPSRLSPGAPADRRPSGAQSGSRERTNERSNGGRERDDALQRRGPSGPGQAPANRGSRGRDANADRRPKETAPSPSTRTKPAPSAAADPGPPASKGQPKQSENPKGGKAGKDQGQ